MKLDFVELENAYDDFFKIQQNQLEIFGELEEGFNQFMNMQSFQGNSADNAKAYLQEFHVMLMNTFRFMLMEYETRLHLLIQNELPVVDDGASPLIDTEYVEELNEKLKTYGTDFDTTCDLLDSAVKPSATIAGVSSTFARTSIEDRFDTIDKNGKEVITDLENFNTAHSNDMDSINDLFSNLDSAFSIMESILTEKQFSKLSQNLVIQLQKIRCFKF